MSERKGLLGRIVVELKAAGLDLEELSSCCGEGETDEVDVKVIGICIGGRPKKGAGEKPVRAEGGGA